MARLWTGRSPERRAEAGNSALIEGNIAVTGTGRCTGATTVALMMAGKAAEAGESVSFTECHEPSAMGRLVYHILSMDRRRGDPVSVYRAAAEGRPLRTIENRMILGDGHIDWRIVVPDDVNDRIFPDKTEMIRIASSASGDVRIFDVSSDGRMDHLLPDMDLVMAVVDPLPSRLAVQGERIASLKYIKSKGVRVIFVVNKAGGGVSRREIKRILRDPHIYFIDAIDESRIYAAEFAGQFPWAVPGVSEAADGLFIKTSRLMSDVIGR